MVPKKLFFTKGVGKHKERLTSFELALRDAGIASQNLVRVSSIFPPRCKVIPRKEGLKYLNHGEPQSLLDVALNNDIKLDHACGGNCACTTCHVWVKEGANNLSEMDDDEADRLDMAADLQLNSRLGCQAVIKGPGKVVVEIPAWNRNYVSEEH